MGGLGWRACHGTSAYEHVTLALIRGWRYCNTRQGMEGLNGASRSRQTDAHL